MEKQKKWGKNYENYEKRQDQLRLAARGQRMRKVCRFLFYYQKLISEKKWLKNDMDIVYLHYLNELRVFFDIPLVGLVVV